MFPLGITFQVIVGRLYLLLLTAQKLRQGVMLTPWLLTMYAQLPSTVM